MAESIGPMWSKSKPNPGAGPTASRWSAPGPGKRTRREDHALLIVRDEFRAGYSSIGLLASRARLRFTGTDQKNTGRIGGKELSSNGNCVFSLVSHRRGSPHLSAFICVHRACFRRRPSPGEARRAVARSLTPANIAQEVVYLNANGRNTFERPYGLAWLLQLAAELKEFDDPEARQWSAALRPLEQAVTARIVEWLPKLQHPIRTGEHNNSAFSMGLMLDYARVTGKRGVRRGGGIAVRGITT
jgi:hypothetical protein